MARKVAKKTARKSASAKKPNFTTYSNLAKNRGKSKRTLKKEKKAREKAEYLATLPKNPLIRFFRRSWIIWSIFALLGLAILLTLIFRANFTLMTISLIICLLAIIGIIGFGIYKKNLRGQVKILAKIFGIALILVILAGGALFMYFRKELESLSPEELAKRVQTTVTKYYDRNGQLLWEDTGTGEYRLVITSDQINKYMKDATVAIEDKDFYKHGGVSLTGTVRAVWSTVRGNTQGGSTLTQQLVKQVFFADEAADRGISGIPRKIKEAILSIEAERVYSKDQILTMYLNESPYGGRRNGVESAAQTYFGKAAKDLTLAEAALLAAIPQNPTNFNPYNIIELCTGANAQTNECDLTNNSLIRRQRTTLDYMAEQGYIKQSEADEAKKVAILDTVKPADSQLAGAKAPHFVQMVKDDLTDKLGAKVVGAGGLKITTSLDIRVQNVLESEMDKLFNGSLAYLPRGFGADNASFTMVDAPTGQVLGMMGSRGYDYPDYGAVNSATSFIQPGSSIKPLVYAALINNQENPNGTFGAGSMIYDSANGRTVQQIYGASLSNANGSKSGSFTIRNGLAQSMNIPAVMAMYYNGVDNTKKFIHEAGDISYCTDGSDNSAQLSSAIGGCGAKQVEHANAFATLARGGVYKPYADILSVENSSGQKLYEWRDEGKQAMDPQTAYIISDILTDGAARAPTFGSSCPVGECVAGIKTATKTGTSDTGVNRGSKDLWMMSYTPKAVLSVWLGNHLPSVGLRAGDGVSLGPIVRDINTEVYKNIFQKDGTYTPNQWFDQPAGIQKLNVSGKTDLFPSWYNKNQKTSQTVKLTFDKVSKKLATDCTPPAAREELDVKQMLDPLSKRVLQTVPPDGYDAKNSDDVHVCGAQVPFFGSFSAAKNGDGTYTVGASFSNGDSARPIQSVVINYNGQSYNAVADGTGFWNIIVSSPLAATASAVATDSQFYTTDSGTVNLPKPTGES